MFLIVFRTGFGLEENGKKKLQIWPFLYLFYNNGIIMTKKPAVQFGFITFSLYDNIERFSIKMLKLCTMITMDTAK